MHAALLLGSAVVLAAEPQWEDLFTPPLFSDNPIPIMMGVDCVAQGHCFVAGGTSSQGMSVYKVNDEYFRDVTRLNVNTPIPLKVVMSVAMRDDTHAVAAGLGLLIGGTYWTIDGKNFNSSLELGVLTSQDVQRLSWGNGGYAFVGQSGDKNGPAVSHDFGITFTGHWWPKDLAPEAPARYGAFPTENTWYVTGGEWPSNNNAPDADQYTHLTQRLRIHKETGRIERVEPRGTKLGNSTKYTGVITKTSDGGKTWDVQYNSSGKFYFNEIDCVSETTCIAVGEGFANDGSTAPGAHILMTVDGKTWTESYVFGADSAGSALAVKMLSEKEAWVAASWQKSIFEKGAVMLHTTDGGKTWNQGSTLSGIGDITAMTFVDSTHAYAVGVTFAEVSTVICMGCGKPPAPSPGSGSFEQVQCSDANCTQGCKTADFPQGQCLQTSSGGSANVTCSADGKNLITEIYSSSDCSGTPKSHTEPTKQCLKASSGGYFENICPPPGVVSTAFASPSARLRTRL